MPDNPGSGPKPVNEAEPSRPAVTGPDWIIPILSLAFAMYYLWSVSEMKWEAKVSSFFVALVLCALIVAFAVRTALGLARGELRLDVTGWRTNPGALARQGFLLGLIVGFIIAIPYLGFTMTVFAFLLASLIGIARMPVGRSLLVSGLIAVVAYLLFIVALRTNFPDGVFERVMNSLIALF